MYVPPRVNLSYELTDVFDNFILLMQNDSMSFRYFLQPNRGFTLTELLVVVSIISLLAAASLTGAITINRRAQALHIAQDMLSIKQAWETWVTDGGVPYPDEQNYPSHTINAANFCDDEPYISETDLFADDDRLRNNTFYDRDVNWNGPYMDSVPTDPWGREYRYDNDVASVFDNCSAGTTPWDGANVFLTWCAGVGGPNENGQYLPLALLIDDIIDGGDGSCAGIFHWNPNPPITNTTGVYVLMLDDNQ
ncbi:type II secretion system protein GspG [Candidatus Roizmanbacteria bacterium]|nr:type II secretion system protein GspG [Candidatus Roizmanbacteria bacterium]